MNIVWESKERSVRDVLQELNKKRQIAYSTVATILRRLETKNLVTKNSTSMTFFYHPTISKEKYSKGIASTFIKNFISSFGSSGMSSFVESLEELPKEKREHLLKMLDKHVRNK